MHCVVINILNTIMEHNDMKISRSLLLVALFGLNLPPTLADDTTQAASTVKITSPTDGSTLDANEEYPLEYEVVLRGANDDHFHVWVDGKRGGPVHALKGNYTLPALAPGEHVIAIKVVDKGHIPTGPEQPIKVFAK